MKTMIKTLREKIEVEDREAALALLPAVFKAIDKAVAKGTIKKNTGARYKSRLSRQAQTPAGQNRLKSGPFYPSTEKT